MSGKWGRSSPTIWACIRQAQKAHPPDASPADPCLPARFFTIAGGSERNSLRPPGNAPLERWCFASNLYYHGEWETTPVRDGPSVRLQRGVCRPVSRARRRVAHYRTHKVQQGEAVPQLTEVLMPKTTTSGKPKKSELPSTIERSDAKAQRTFAKVHDRASETYGEGERAHRTAYAALKHTTRRSAITGNPRTIRVPRIHARVVRVRARKSDRRKAGCTSTNPRNNSTRMRAGPAHI
jgi:hypothetical protein